MRRCGKSTVFELYQQHLLDTGVVPEQIIALNLEDLDYEDLLDYKVLYRYVKERLCQGRYTYVFIDEIQHCIGFEKVVDSLFIKDMVDVYITGSNAYMLSGELATLLSGRYVQLDMLPLSFSEFRQAQVARGATDMEVFQGYLEIGAFPYLATTPQTQAQRRHYLEGVYSSILIKDVAQREGITDVSLLESIIKTMAGSMGSPVSTKKIADTIASTGRKISVNSVNNYVKALCDAYIFYKVDRYDIKGRQHLKTLGKYYMVDLGLRNFLLSASSPDLGHKIENVVYLELCRRGYNVNVGKLGKYEVDFVAQNQDGLLYVQVSVSVLDEATLKRELRPLEVIPDHHPKLLLTLDQVGSGSNYNGIRQLNLLEWL